MAEAVVLQGIVKRYGAFLALDQVDFAAQPGEIHALVGENGAGKTTLMKVLYGAVRPDEGQILVGSRSFGALTSAEAAELGIGMVSQHYAVLPELTNLENLILGQERGVIRRDGALVDRAQTLAERLGYEFDWGALSETLSPAAAQKLEILKLLWRDARILILDEPTAMLSPADAAQVYASLTALADQGATVIVVTHRLPEVMSHARRVTVLRAGKKVASAEVSAVTDQQLAAWMVGDALITQVPRKVTAGEVRLVVRGLDVRGDRGLPAVRDADFEVRAGEVVGIAGVDGSGQRELVQALVGVRRAHAGRIEWNGRPWDAHPASRYRAGLRVVPEDRLAEGMIAEWSLIDNSILSLQRIAPWERGDRRAWATRVADRFHTRRRSVDDPIGSLSGGNQQRFVVARALESSPALLVAFQPTRGLDIRATEEIYSGIQEVCAQGAAALVISFDLDELLVHCQRIMVMREGRMIAPESRDREAIGRAMTGAAA
jgi:simple sugar transport system ATP-binding protein